jgi:predicted aspartyl protease
MHREKVMKKSLAVLTFLSAASASWAQPVTTQLDSVAGVPEIDKTTQTQDVKFRNEHDDRMTVPVRLSGAGPYRFLVDTGADRTAVSREIADRLNLKSAGGAELHTVAGTSEVRTATVHDFEFTHPPERSLEAAVLESANIGADGIVGVDMLRSQRVQFDFQNQTMSIVPSKSPDFRPEPGTIIVEARRKNGRLIVTDAEANGARLTVVLDTGSQITIGNQALRDRLVGRNLINGQQTVELESVTGEKISGEYMFIRELNVGGIGLNNLAIVFTNAHTFKQLGLDKRPALLLGMNAIRAFKKVSIDFANKKFRVVLPESSGLDVRLASAKD